MVEIIFVEDQHPLKQGLKLEYIQVIKIIIQVEDQHPLKQGLKHHYTKYLEIDGVESKTNIH